MDKRFANIFGLTEEQSIALLDTPPEQADDESERYIAASQLANYPSEASIDALIRAVHVAHDSLDNRITRRKSVESLGKLKAVRGLDAVRTCLTDDDRYTVEAAVWAIGEIGTENTEILEEITQLLAKPDQTYRVIIHTLVKLDYGAAVDRVRPFMEHGDEPTASAAIATVCRFARDFSQIDRVISFLQSDNINARRACLEDLINARYYGAMPAIACCPISPMFRLRAVRTLAESGMASGEVSIEQVLPVIEQILRDHPQDLKLVHEYDQPPALEFLIRELYHTDFGRTYLAIQTFIEQQSDAAPAALFDTYAAEAHNDYGAHYHVMKLMGWLHHQPAYDLLLEALRNTSPQFMKSRAAAAISLGELNDQQAIAPLHTSAQSKIWMLQFASLMALEKLGDYSQHKLLLAADDWAVRAKANQAVHMTQV
ncbi:HEAT repeat domain-containing protein [Leptolyngbya cf. ectocarpi LEGE 11479]|uniref:HEAT repeat domain-containing protein n=1 Tax=Leptolyngbya cf. ectocarpi LEGE 11479 TaxID=1828722 RepID=A0A928ZSJ9_LEPEC|nr:HEAT repeat domain-containing protein [Leptolyngbya ectocarpi]MBE9066357.1 HEAT repeat domain-containing protein [Leptolyngbya cf. ectocarpi LEGE 11479]